jgi:hypothetical protein
MSYNDDTYTTLPRFINGTKSIELIKNSSERKKYNIILDLDSTLVCSVLFKELNLIPKNINLSYKDYIYDTFNLSNNYRIFIRPYLYNFLNYISKFSNISVWTMADELYANFIIDNIFPKEIKPEFIFSRKHSDYGLHKYLRLKPLEFVYENFPNDYSNKNTIIIDDISDVASANINNSIQIKPFNLFTDKLHLFNKTVITDTCLIDIIPDIKYKLQILDKY